MTGRAASRKYSTTTRAPPEMLAADLATLAGRGKLLRNIRIFYLAVTLRRGATANNRRFST
jgi:hypothetical protein